MAVIGFILALVYLFIVLPIMKRKEEEEKRKKERQRTEQIKSVVNYLEVKYRKGYYSLKEKHPYWTVTDFYNHSDEIVTEHKKLELEHANVNTQLMTQLNMSALQKMYQKAEEQRKAEQQRKEEMRRIEEERKRKEEEMRKSVHADKIIRILQNNNISYFYHFTARENIQSIRQQGGLYSWQYLSTHHINIPLAGGSIQSHDLDSYLGLADYVHLSFCSNHPMAYRHIVEGEDMVFLKISTEVAVWKDTIFSDMNAVDSLCKRAIGLEGLNLVNFDATKQFYMRNDDPLFKYKQAEILIKTHIPIKYILNIETF